jgi:UDP-hydrolysing UDP-N-acetyl-D-glucosamine 2-epimerase
MKRKIAVITSSRADYSHLYWPLHDLSQHPGIELKIIALGAHLSPEFGNTVNEIESDGMKIASKIECLLSSDSDVGMAKTIGLATLGLADLLAELRPDILLLIADRYEMLAPAAVALALRIPIAHIEGGEISEGAIDDAVRNALTKMSHIHFTSTHNARDRVIQMDEEEWRVHRVGAPSLDHIRRQRLFNKAELQTSLNLDLDAPTILVAYHPVTIGPDTLSEMGALFEALSSLAHQTLFCFPNSDAGSRALIRRTNSFIESKPRARIYINLAAPTYLSLLGQVDLFIGNSSSGIMEAASFSLPVVNIGLRQQGRERTKNVIDAAADGEAIRRGIQQGLDPLFRQSLVGLKNPYGDGFASETIVRVLTSLPSREKLLMKRHAELQPAPGVARPTV